MTQLPNLITIKEFAEMLNASTRRSIGENTVYDFVRRPGFPAITIGNRYYILIDRVDDWMTAQSNLNTAHEPSEASADGN